MLIKELEKNLKILTDEAEKLSIGYTSLEKQICDLEKRKKYIKAKLDEINSEISVIRQNIKELYDNANDPFIKDFMKASYFCDVYEQEYNQALSYVKIDADEIIACDGYKGIIIRNQNIPEKLKNTYIKWNIKSDFYNNAEKDVKYPNINFLKQIIKKSKKDYLYKINTSIKDFNIIFDVQETINAGINIAILNNRIAVNQKYLELALYVLSDDKKCTVYITRQEILFENNKMSIILEPILLPKKE